MPPEIIIRYRHLDKGDEKKQENENYRKQPHYIFGIVASCTGDNQLVFGHLCILTQSQQTKIKKPLLKN